MKVIVKKTFRDARTKEVHKVRPGQETVIDMSEERLAEAQAALEAYGGGFLEAIPDVDGAPITPLPENDTPPPDGDTPPPDEQAKPKPDKPDTAKRGGKKQGG